MTAIAKSRPQSQSAAFGMTEQNASYRVLGPVTDDAGAVLDLSALYAMNLDLYFPDTSRGITGVIATIGQSAGNLVGFSDGTVQVSAAAIKSNVNVYGAGRYLGRLTAARTNTDALQDLMEIQLTVSNP